MKATRTCSADDCDRQLGPRAILCTAHDARLRRIGSLGDGPVRAYGVTLKTASSKRCTECHEVKPLTDFYRRSLSADGYRPLCKPCAGVRTAMWRTANPERAADNLRFASLRRRYGLTREQFAALVDKQDGCCGICRSNLSDKPCVDHDHACCSGEKSCGRCIRGLLCRPCNVLLGMAKDDVETLRAAMDYLMKPIGGPS